MLFVSFAGVPIRRVGFAFAALVATAGFSFAQSPSAAAGFNPDVDGNVYAVAVQPDGGRCLAAAGLGLGGSGRRPDGARGQFTPRPAPRRSAADTPQLHPPTHPGGSPGSRLRPDPHPEGPGAPVASRGKIVVGG